jgi:hypothetical protein
MLDDDTPHNSAGSAGALERLARWLDQKARTLHAIKDSILSIVITLISICGICYAGFNIVRSYLGTQNEPKPTPVSPHIKVSNADFVTNIDFGQHAYGEALVTFEVLMSCCSGTEVLGVLDPMLQQNAFAQVLIPSIDNDVKFPDNAYNLTAVSEPGSILLVIIGMMIMASIRLWSSKLRRYLTRQLRLRTIKT